MKIEVNGERHDLPDGCTAADLVAHLGFTGRRIAMEVNREIVPRSEYAQFRLSPGDRVEVVHAIGGG